MLVLVFWVKTPCELVVDTNVSEEHIASIFWDGIYLSRI
jgi:hypothetical protein